MNADRACDDGRYAFTPLLYTSAFAVFRPVATRENGIPRRAGGNAGLSGVCMDAVEPWMSNNSRHRMWRCPESGPPSVSIPRRFATSRAPHPPRLFLTPRPSSLAPRPPRTHAVCFVRLPPARYSSPKRRSTYQRFRRSNWARTLFDEKQVSR